MTHGAMGRTCLALTSAAPARTEIREHSDALVRHVVEPAAATADFEVLRTEGLASPGHVSDALLQALRTADTLVADLSFGDAMVMYALGVRHSIGMPAIHVHTPNADLPFRLDGLDSVVIDLQDVRAIKRATDELAFLLARAASQPHKPSPVLATLELEALRSSERPDAIGMEPVVTGLKAIEDRIAVLDRWLRDEHAPEKAPTKSRRVFLVHGHDGELKHQLARVLTELGLEVVILQELPDSGRTLLEKLRVEVANIGFVFVLLTPDDLGGSCKEERRDYRPRQNVVFEHGLFSGLLEPSRVCAIQRGDLELPSDLNGLVVKRIPEGLGIEAVQFDIARELKRAGYDVDVNRLVES